MHKNPGKFGMKHPKGMLPSQHPTGKKPKGMIPSQPPAGMLPTQQMPFTSNMSPAQMQPTMAPQAVLPQTMSPTPGPLPTGVPTNVAPARRVMHPTQYQERQRVTRYPIENVYPTHTHNVHHHVCEYSSSYPHTESYQDCYHRINVNSCPPPRRRRPC